MKSKIIFNKSKILATVGPASNTREKLEELIAAGADIFRLNFSHGSHEDHKKVIGHVRELNETQGTHICLLQDLQGPKIRVNEVENGEVQIKKGDQLIITVDNVIGTAQRVGTSYEALPKDVKVGDTILVDDGKIELKVLNTNGIEVTTEVVYGGALKSRKGINLPNTAISAPSLTEKDERDLEFGLDNDVEWIALSFVRSAEDVIALKEKIKARGKKIKVVAKIEKPEAVKDIDRIIEATDAVMVARGDLGVEIEMEEVPMIQKMIVRKCNSAAKPVIIATQMMESMIENPRPTRAETNDIANAVVDGADALMLSAETAAGKYPMLSVKSMAKTIASVEAETESIYFNHTEYIHDSSPTFVNDNLVLIAARLAKRTKAKAIVGMTNSGYTAFRLACHRPQADIFIFTSNKKMLTTMNLIWGIRAFYYDKMVSTDATIEDVEEILKENGHLKKGDIFITTASMPIHQKKRTNMVKINTVE
ncbi:pyruvate kinase [Fulvivirgaceae bacterium BMA10]|uniref:Pyruvate kinase n=1 Tax=Splendidivirga corallicola TaxID=3051826 RepID=A0ABT8KQB5_9BACT|nr:pyruvate kinase [Fulvivirgaceae bacterium BMA10]